MAALGALSVLAALLLLNPAKAEAAVCSQATIEATFSTGTLYVSTEIGGTGDRQNLLRARAGAVGPWEKFNICFYDGYETIASVANNRYVSAEKNLTGEYYRSLRARATEIGPWEKFTISCPGTAAPRDCTIFSQATQRYVSVEKSGVSGQNQGVLRARASSVGPWEIVRIWGVSESSSRRLEP
ncbi:conserved exported hypothetical protein [Frankia canadensis]|uniref:Secreted protein n=1 Tax=Frankia canadensis TaxID=1836972 RepID=A0A2I2KTB7_9ACTN|nr:hypothetical protein [Frankia canadensis]SNQ48911.1 conserved exported hypothetical protein [Frankia canadensis]SOU56201.1 conserved exported hypothetical protein [Frankia canadensis]